MVVSHISKGFTGSSDRRIRGVIRGYVELIDSGVKVHDHIIAEVAAEDNVIHVVRTGTEHQNVVAFAADNGVVAVRASIGTSSFTIHLEELDISDIRIYNGTLRRHFNTVVAISLNGKNGGQGISSRIFRRIQRRDKVSDACICRQSRLSRVHGTINQNAEVITKGDGSGYVINSGNLNFGRSTTSNRFNTSAQQCGIRTKSVRSTVVSSIKCGVVHCSTGSSVSL